MKKKRFIPKICIVYTENSEALYVEDDLICQKRHITERDIHLAINMMYIQVDKKWLHRRQRFPGKYSEIPLRRLK